MTLLPPISPLFPYTTLFRSLPLQRNDRRATARFALVVNARGVVALVERSREWRKALGVHGVEQRRDEQGLMVDRKSTRLNSSHPSISYAVFCLKKKNERYHY